MRIADGGLAAEWLLVRRRGERLLEVVLGGDRWRRLGSGRDPPASTLGLFDLALLYLISSLELLARGGLLLPRVPGLWCLCLALLVSMLSSIAPDRLLLIVVPFIGSSSSNAPGAWPSVSI